MLPDSWDIVRLTCNNCRHPVAVTRIWWDRVAPRMACGHCRKVTTWARTP